MSLHSGDFDELLTWSVDGESVRVLVKAMGKITCPESEAVALQVDDL